MWCSSPSVNKGCHGSSFVPTDKECCKENGFYWCNGVCDVKKTVPTDKICCE